MKDRLIAFLAYLGIGQLKFEEKIGVSRGYVNKIGDNITVKTLDKIVSNYPELNIYWLKTGEGEMLKSDKPKYNEVTPRPESDYMMVEFADLRASAGRLGMGDVKNLPESRTRLLPKEYANGKFLVVGVDGNSMYDGKAHSLSDGDEVLICLCEDGISGDLPIKKSVFVITTSDGNVLKQITEINKEEQYILCHSWNAEYEDFKIKFDDIYQIFTVCKIVQKQISLV